MISCSPEDKDIKEPQKLVDVVKEEDDKAEDVEEPEEIEEIELIEYKVENPLMVYMKGDGLYFSYLDSGEETKMIEGSL